MCKVLKISESGYYRWLKNKDKPSKRQLLLVKIKEIISKHPDNANYGYERMDTVHQLKQRYGNLQGVVLHSDRGSQYTSEAYRKLLKNCGIIQSLSSTGHCYDNARMESFFCYS